jgi:hypothetical protein
LAGSALSYRAVFAALKGGAVLRGSKGERKNFRGQSVNFVFFRQHSGLLEKNWNFSD